MVITVMVLLAFHAPEGAICEKDTVDNVCHTFAIGDSIWGVVIGFYDTNASEEYFKECIDSWRNTELDGYDFFYPQYSSGSD